MTNKDTRAALEAACARAVDSILRRDEFDVAVTHVPTGDHVVRIMTREAYDLDGEQLRRYRDERDREANRADKAENVIAQWTTQFGSIDAALTAFAGRTAERDAEKARADAAERMVVELRDRLRIVRESFLGTHYMEEEHERAIDAAISSTAEVAGRWVHEDEIVGVEMVDRMRAERDAAIAARDEAVANLNVYEQRIREIADDVFGLKPAHGASVVLLDAIGRQCHRERIEKFAAERARDEVENELGCIKEAITQHLPRFVNENDEEDELDAVDTIEEAGRELASVLRARDEVGIQFAAAQARIKLLEEGVELLRHIDECKGEPKWGPNGVNTYRVSCDVIDIGVGCYLARLDAVPGDALAPKFTAALEASGIDAGNVKGVE